MQVAESICSIAREMRILGGLIAITSLYEQLFALDIPYRQFV